MSALPSPKPFLPSDIPRDRLLVRCAFAAGVAACRGRHARASDVAAELWPRDRHVLEYIQRGAVPPASTTGSGWADALAATAWGGFLGSLKPSAGAALIRQGQMYDLSGYVKVNLPRGTINEAARWVGEGQPIPTGQGTITSISLGPPAKLAMISVVTREIFEHSVLANGELAISRMLQDAATAALDTAIFGNAAATSISPAGILNGISATTASTSTDGNAACRSDVRAVTDAVVTGGGGANVLYFCSPGRKTALDSYMPQLAGQVYASAYIPAAELIAIDSNAFASGFDANPQVSASIDGILHMEDTTPLPISTPGLPNTVAAPVQSIYQLDLIGLKMILRAAWVLRLPAVAFISSGMTW